MGKWREGLLCSAHPLHRSTLRPFPALPHRSPPAALPNFHPKLRGEAPHSFRPHRERTTVFFLASAAGYSKSQAQYPLSEPPIKVSPCCKREIECDESGIKLFGGGGCFSLCPLHTELLSGILVSLSGSGQATLV